MTSCAYLPKAVQSDAIFGQKLLGLLDELRLSKSLPHTDAAFAALQGKQKTPTVSSALCGRKATDLGDLPEVTV